MIYANPEHHDKLSKAHREALAQMELHWGPPPEGEDDQMLTLAKLRDLAKGQED